MSASAAPSFSFAMPAHPSRSGSYPEILLDQNCRVGYCGNSTYTTTENSEGLSVEVSFEIHRPPALSLCFIRCYDLTGRQRLPQERLPCILSMAGGLVLLDIPFNDGADIKKCRYTDYFVYRAGPGNSSLHLLPGPYPARCSMKAAILPTRDDGGEHYAVMFPYVEFVVLESRHHYALHIYRSDSKAWCGRVVRIADDAETRSAAFKVKIHCPTSVVHAGPGLISWVDLWWGVLLCNVLDENPTIRFVAVPVPEPRKTPSEFFLVFEDQNSANRPYRQMTVHNGAMKFIELQYHRGPASCFNMKRRRDDQGWTATTWTKPISSSVWLEGLTIDTSDMSVADSSFLQYMLPEILDGEKKLTWENLISGAPTLSLNDDHIFYIEAKTSSWHQTTFLLAVNTRSLTLESCAQCSGENIAWLEPTYVPSLLSSYFGVTTRVLF